MQKKEPILLDPWSESTMNNLLENINVDLKKFAGYHQSNKVYHGKVPLTSPQNVLRNKVTELGTGTWSCGKTSSAHCSTRPPTAAKRLCSGASGCLSRSTCTPTGSSSAS
ncbi:hypothetical protein DAI22_06g124700 [Oryza sativa Japonica Group]|nr:hypothetical protein DAI22_06g124700 [Oryza sativa Japonica Group]